MHNINWSIFLNSGLFVFLSIRFSAHLTSRQGLAKLIVFIAAIFAANFFLLRDRYSVDDAALRASSIAVGFIALVFVMSAIRASRDTGKVGAANAPTDPSDQAS
jgi:hypothetical protein